MDGILHEISDLETVMESIQNLRQQLVEMKDKITKSINFHKRLVSALWRLPTEVLSQIFHHCVPEILSESDKFKTSSVLEAPMLLTAVCRRWREVAVAMPSLWCRLAVSVDRECQWERQIFCYESWLKRSQGRPLSLALSVDRGAYGSTRILHVLRPHVNQISSLSIRFSIADLNEPEQFLKFLSPALQELTIVILGVRYIVQGISQLPSTLRSLKFIGPWFDVLHLDLCNPVWTHLTHVEMNIHKSATVLRLLQLAPELSSLTIDLKIDDVRDLEPFTHTNLRSLRITCDYSESTSRFSDLFDALSLPNLRIFQASGKPPWPHEEFKAFLTRSNCPLETLNLGAGVKTSRKQWAEYFSLIPSLEVVGSRFQEA
ncbi:hypothetical protein EDB19DRAFT_1661924 [Suillus lakei]|nr:hypothetical protein EDB19DRAFT_1661924 [Suillus lakei]